MFRGKKIFLQAKETDLQSVWTVAFCEWTPESWTDSMLLG